MIDKFSKIKDNMLYLQYLLEIYEYEIMLVLNLINVPVTFTLSYFCLKMGYPWLSLLVAVLALVSFVIAILAAKIVIAKRLEI